MSRKGGHRCGGDRSSGCKSRGRKSGGDKSGGNKTGGNKSNGNKNKGNKSDGGKSSILIILLRIGVGTPNIRIHFDGTSHVGIYLGITDGFVLLNVRGVVIYIKLSSITAVEIGVKENRNRNKKHPWKCKKIKAL